MNDFSKILLAASFSLASVAFGWSLNQFGQWVKTRQEDKKHLNFVLFNLLETYSAFIRSDFDKIIKKTSEVVYERIPENQKEEITLQQIYHLYNDFFIKHMKPELTDEINSIKENYQESIKTLASIDPMMAYYLSRRVNIFEGFDQINNWIHEATSKLPGSEYERAQGSKCFSEYLKPKLISDVFMDLECDIKKIAWKISPYTWMKAKSATKKMKSNAEHIVDQEINDLFEELLISATQSE